MSPGIAQTMTDADAVVLYNESGRRIFERAFGDGDGPQVAVIGHGVDEAFRPLDSGLSRRPARFSVFGSRPELDDSFIVLNANRNSPRKKIDTTLRGFAQFSAGKTDVFLYLHMGMKDLDCDILSLAAQLGIRDKLLTTTLAPEQPRLPDEQLNGIYNACDVGLNTSTGEGWGLVAFEHGATGAAQIMPAHPSCAELWGDSALLVDVDDDEGVAPSDVAAALETLYSDKDLRLALAIAAHELATTPRFSWDHVAALWNKLLLQVVAADA
jgi:glycosyltransferase involved in cell wall biosynthesis